MSEENPTCFGGLCEGIEFRGDFGDVLRDHVAVNLGAWRIMSFCR